MFHINITQKELGEVWLVILVREIPAALLTYSLFPSTKFSNCASVFVLGYNNPKSSKKTPNKTVFLPHLYFYTSEICRHENVSQVPSVKK